MKKLMFFVVFAIIFLFSCSKDDDKKCDSCDLAGRKAEMCDNGDGTYTFSYAGESDKVTQELLDFIEMTPKEYVEFICAAGAEAL
ncbi:hypothetical protein [Flagellimonas beolgyonensis]|uniref:hypothetical protein n=1 Tax=Flagellimonas beolgyonensis TaxID=864064 RepID=UPI000F8E729C|nr:hypothetical protein [Allomuricauda beolgyonensis]